MPDSTSKNGSTLSGWAAAAAILVVGAWLVMLLWLIRETGASEVEWARLLVILASLEAVAFAAAGALFGATVQRQRVAEALDRADKADQQASEARATASHAVQDAANGKALAAAVKARLTPRAASGTERVSADAAGQAPDLLGIAQRLFPD